MDRVDEIRERWERRLRIPHYGLEELDKHDMLAHVDALKARIAELEHIAQSAQEYVKARAEFIGYNYGRPDYDGNTHGDLDVKYKQAHAALLAAVEAAL